MSSFQLQMSPQDFHKINYSLPLQHVYRCDQDFPSFDEGLQSDGGEGCFLYVVTQG